MIPKTLFYVLFLGHSIHSVAQSTPLAYSNAGDIYIQNFNALPTTGSFTLTGKGPHALNTAPVNAIGLSGWQIMQLTGSQGNTNFSAGTGSSTGSAVYGFGLTGNANRALGTLAAGTGTYAFGIILQNQTGLPLNHISIHFTATQFRKGGSGNKNTWRFGYQTGQQIDLDVNHVQRDSAFNLTSIHTSTGSATLNGHLLANQYSVTAEIKNIRWLPREKLVLRWEDIDETGSDDAMAIDDFSFSAIQKANQPTISSLIADSIATNFISVKTEIDDQLAETKIQFEFDSTEKFSTPILIDSVSHKIIQSGSGNTIVRAFQTGLTPGRHYFFRAKASNSEGVIFSNILKSRTQGERPLIKTDSTIQLTTTSYTLYGTLLNTGGEPITEMGFCWSINDTPSIHDNIIIATTQNSIFNATIQGLVGGTKFHMRAYAINQSGIGYGNILTVFTPTSIEYFTTNKYITNQDTVVYQLKSIKKVSGIGSADFKIESSEITDATILSVSEDQQSYKVIIHTGTKDATIAPLFLPNRNHEPAIINMPYQGNQLIIDKTAPYIRSINIPDRSSKAGDSIKITIHTTPEKDTLNFISGDLVGYPMSKFQKTNDSTWTTICYIKTGGSEVLAHQNISANLLLKDIAGNSNQIQTFTITQNNDAIDLTRPSINRIEFPEKKIFKAGDSILFTIRFSEQIRHDTTLGVPVLSITIGTRIKNPFLKKSIADTALLFYYIVQPEELDMDGIRIANTITLNNSFITDLAGNTFINHIPNAGIISHLTIDAVQPSIMNVITPIAKTYGIGDTLLLDIFFSESIIVNEEKELPYLEISIANQIYSARYLKQYADNQLKFYWVVERGLLDKDGIGLSGILYNTEGIKDSIGNTILSALKGIGALSGVDIDGIAPYFVDTTSLLNVCTDKSSLLENIGLINDEEKGESIHWTVVQSPRYGRIIGLPFSIKSGNDPVYPKGLQYISPDTSAIQDEFVIAVSDGANTIQKRFKININPKIVSNQIETAQIICAGMSPEKIKSKIEYKDDQNHLFTWQMTDVKDSVSFITAAGNYSNETYLPTSLNHTTFFRRITYAGGCTDTSNTVKIEVVTKGLWIGKQSNDWNTGSNWCGAFVPDKQTDVRIIGLNDRVVLNDSGFCRSLFLNKNAELNITGSLLFTGSLQAINNIDASIGTIISNSNEKQFIDSRIFKEKNVGQLILNGRELELVDTLMINRSFSIHQGKFISHDMLTLSDTAIIAPNAMGSSYEGRINVKKEITSTNKANFLSHPFKDDIVIHQLALDTLILKKSSSYASLIGHNKPADSTFYLVTQKQGIENNKLEWHSLLPDTITNKSKWIAGQGIRLQKIAQLRDTSQRTIYLDLNGRPNIGDVDILFPLLKDTGFYLTGNPYYAPIESLRVSTSDGIGNYFWIWDANLSSTGGYVTKAFAGKNTIAPLEGFIIKIIPERSSSLFFSEQSKLERPIPDSLEGIIENTYQLELSLYQDSKLHDKLLILDVDSARVRFDATDAEKIKNPLSNLFSLSSDHIPLAIDARQLTNRSYIPIGVESEEGKYNLKFTRVWLEKNTDLELHDLYLGRKIKVGIDSSYEFEITKDTASSGLNRFIIRSPIPPEPSQEPMSMSLFPMPARDIMNVTFIANDFGNTVILIKNLSGQILQKTALGIQKEGTYQLSVNGLLTGQYILELHCGKQFIAKPIIKL